MPPSTINPQDTAAIQAAYTQVALCDRTHWGRIQVKGDDRLRFLHNQSTNDFQSLKPGEGCDTVFVTSTARTIDLVTAYVSENEVILLTSPNRCEFLYKWLDKYIFFADKVELLDISSTTCTLSLIGTDSDAVIQKIAGGELIGKPQGSHQLYNLHGANQVVRIAVGSGLALPGYTLTFSNQDKTAIWNQLVEMGVVEMSQKAWEILRITQGRPVPEQELTDDYNPLEVGLWQTVSFSKGCYIGQETIARLNTYKGVKTYLWGIRLNAPVEVGTAVTVNGEKVGVITSFAETTDGYFALGYIRSKAGTVGLQVQVGESQGEVVEVPFVSHAYPEM
ncbi:YgfZ/GcvT domain-containing protein [Calothrix sp. PCC 6303]|uniref:CAF17-like 4Fe-4S cluster assembly/insertion protein YgfZ n=1 Tax=Calothrix sp. PCC 6303 TaxID=1170562 RepID=UPI0002A006DC|nr:folate-binding protein YgfZ [Calothrix sp. PCC 6303]AFZ00473.1 folate-binding protein YgfZ [Calothrix sp. PCC 6303]